MCTHFNDLLTANNATNKVLAAFDERYGADWTDRIDLSQEVKTIAQVAATLEGRRHPERYDVMHKAARRFDDRTRRVLTAWSPLLIGAFVAAVRQRQTERADEQTQAAERVAVEVTTPAPVDDRTPVSA